MKYILFHRHGHRTPTKTLTNFDWSKHYISQSEVLKLNNKFLIKNHNTQQKKPYDLHAGGGYLTLKGLKHLNNVGTSLLSKYPVLEAIANTPEKLSKQIFAYSTNYTRTQLSVQSLLNGLVYSNATTRDIGGLTINVRDVKSCGMSFYDGYKELASSLMSKIQQKEAFITMDSSPKITELKNEMISRFPSLKLQLPSLPNDSKSFRFDWLTLFDYYKCHAAHDAPIDDDMIIHEQTVSSFMLHRFHMYYSDPHFLAHASQSMLNDIIKVIKKETSRNELHVFSCHDVTILALLHALSVKDISSWPPYGATLLFEINSENEIKIYYNDQLLERKGTNNTLLTIEDLQNINTQNDLLIQQHTSQL